MKTPSLVAEPLFGTPPAATGEPLPSSPPTDLTAAVGLTLLPGIGPKLTRQLVSYCGSAAAVLGAPADKLLRIPGIGPALTSALAGAAQARREAEALVARCRKEGIRILWYQHADFPARLRALPDAPALLYCQGPADLSAPRAVALVGTRLATDYGRRATEKVVHGLQPYGALVVSGLAYGIDIMAHRAALDAGLPTVGVLAGGLDRLYPAEHRRTADRMVADGGALLTEYPFGTKPMKLQFPARNRIIAGLTDATIVVEAGATGGALITAELAQDYDRAVLAVPGDIFAPTSAGCNKLIKDLRAQPCLGPDDVVEALNWDGALHPTPAAAVSAEPEIDFASYEPTEAAVLRALLDAPDRTDHIDNLSWRTQLPMNAVSAALLTLELSGVVSALPGKLFRLLA